MDKQDKNLSDSEELTSEVLLHESRQQNESLKRRIKDLEGLLEQERDQHHTAMQNKEKELNLLREDMEEELNLRREDMEEELNLLREDKEKQLQEYQDLLDIKLALDKEIEAFRKVLEVEGTRLNITPTKSPLADVQQSKPAQCAPVRGAKRKHTVLHTEEGSTDDSQVSSAAKGDIEVHDHDQEGKYVKPFKKGNTEAKCPVPFSLNVKHKLRQQQFQQSLQQAQIFKSLIRIMQNRGVPGSVPQPSPGNSNSSRQPSASPHNSPHPPQPGIWMKPSTGPPVAALQAVQQVQVAAAARQPTPHMVAPGVNYGKGNPVVSPPTGNPSVMPSQQMQPQMQKSMGGLMMPGVPSRMLQGTRGMSFGDGSGYNPQGIQGQPPQPQQMGIRRPNQLIGPGGVSNTMGNPGLPIGPPQGLPVPRPAQSIPRLIQSLQQLLQGLTPQLAEACATEPKI